MRSTQSLVLGLVGSLGLASMHISLVRIALARLWPERHWRCRMAWLTL